MVNLSDSRRIVVQGKVRMTPSEALVETLVSYGVTDVFGIVGSAYMDALDIFPAAGIRFIPTVPASPTSSPRSPPPTGRTRR